MNRALVTVTAVCLTAAAATACGSSSSGGTQGGNSASTGASASACSPSNLHTKSSGRLTIGVDQPVYPPWFIGNKPQTGKGFEGAVDAAIAKQLGYSPSQVSYTRVTFNQAIIQPFKFDFDLDEFSITAAREKHVDFSAPYYNVTQAVVTVNGSKATSVTTLAGLKSLTLGVQVGTTSYDAIENVIKPASQPKVYNSNSDVLQALKNHQIDALVTDLPTAFYMTSAQLTGGKIVGQLPASSGKQEQFGALLAKHSPLTSCVSKAITSLQSSGQLMQIQQRWLAQAGKAPVLS